jgi:ATP-dependent Zn protease
MKTAIKRVPAVLTLPLLALAVLALAASGAQGAAYQKESFSEFEAQLKAGQIHEATINKRVRSVRLTLTDGRLVLTKYAPHEEPYVIRQLRTHHVPTTILTVTQAKKEQGKRPIHHKLRYIVGGVVIAVVVIVGGVVLYNRRRRFAAERG